jgi:hypothetical protein
MGKEGMEASLVLLRGADTVRVQMARGPWEIPPEPRPEPMDELEEGIFYVDMSAIPSEEFLERLDDLYGARGVIFDLRISDSALPIVPLLTNELHASSHWQAIPRTIYPDRERPLPPDEFGLFLQPSERQLEGKVVFLTDAQTIGQSEAQLFFVAHDELAEIIGSPTAGSQAGVHAFEVPGGYRIPFTAVRGVKLDGSRQFGIGVHPTIPVQRTLRAVLEGRDEVLETALRVIRGEGG